MMSKFCCVFTLLMCQLVLALGAYAQDTNVSTTVVSYQTLATSPQLPRAIVTNLRPDNGSYVTTNPPYICMKHGKGKILGASMWLDGQDVSAFAVVGDHSVSYSPSSFLSLGDHWVKVSGTTTSGSLFSQLMAFTVQATGPTVDLTGAVLSPTAISAAPPAALPAVAQSTTYQSTTSSTYPSSRVMGAPSTQSTTTTTTTVTSVPLVQRNIMLSSLSTIKIIDNVTRGTNNGDEVGVVLFGRPNGIATFDLVPGSSPSQIENPASPAITGIQMKQISPGIYEARCVVGDSNFFNNATLVGHLTLPTGESLMASSATVNDPAFYAMYVQSPLYATVWVPNIDLIGELQGADNTVSVTRTTTLK